MWGGALPKRQHFLCLVFATWAPLHPGLGLCRHLEWVRPALHCHPPPDLHSLSPKGRAGFLVYSPPTHPHNFCTGWGHVVSRAHAPLHGKEGLGESAVFVSNVGASWVSRLVHHFVQLHGLIGKEAEVGEGLLKGRTQHCPTRLVHLSLLRITLLLRKCTLHPASVL